MFPGYDLATIRLLHSSNFRKPSKTAFSSLTRKLLILKLTSSFFFFMKIRTTLQLISILQNDLSFFRLLQQMIHASCKGLDHAFHLQLEEQSRELTDGEA